MENSLEKINREMGAKLRGKSALEASKEEKIDNRNYVKPINKVEPKFKVSDWVVNTITNKVEQVIELTDCEYICSGHLIVSFDVQHILRKWTIQDAKDGDVLACNINKAEIGGDIEKLPNITPTICLYQNVVKDKDYIHTYCSLYNGSSLVLSNSMYYNTFVYNIHPATKEQREQLEKEITEAGYEWNADKKELKKIE